ncbi:uncharacterized protein FPRO_07130 [Fusarium proliferatum ET1]|uniref:Uncharacterized protein n=1 Tax=Fusarium proliferatum (strain ET1) TaxID=1227346 RepID=A0A1L7VA88_FUSPR|nr:uncharacterized protein FPRO_07130 [Fusarium proliferatum ET1]CZR37679.1 uncharacterized protein FPRO_07130 [Fusarium proliferatum ET1]
MSLYVGMVALYALELFLLLALGKFVGCGIPTIIQLNSPASRNAHVKYPFITSRVVSCGFLNQRSHKRSLIFAHFRLMDIEEIVYTTCKVRFHVQDGKTNGVRSRPVRVQQG